MADLVITNAHLVLTMDDAGTEHRDVDIAIKDGVIVDIGPFLDTTEGERLDAKDCLVTPGLVNTHHHLYQNLTRAVPAAQNAQLFDWLKVLYPIWGRMGPDEIRVSTTLGLAELALSGCTMSSDHLYMFPNGARLDDSLEGAAEVGIRFHATRGAMSIGQSAGGLPPDALVEDEAAILADSERVVAAFHDGSDAAMTRVGLAPCSPFSVSRDLMRDAAILARELGVMLHTHLAEDDDDVAYSLEKFGCSPGDYAQELGWTGDDVWHAHCVKLDGREIDLFAQTRTGVAHCPCSNCRLGSGVAPVRDMVDAGVPVGLGVDGSASNDSGNLIDEARQALLLQRVAFGAGAMDAREALRLATRGGAEVLGRGDHLGQIVPGYRADIAIWDMTGVESAGLWDPGAMLLAGPRRARDVLVEGRPVVAGGQMVGLDLGALIVEHTRLAKDLING